MTDTDRTPSPSLALSGGGHTPGPWEYRLRYSGLSFDVWAGKKFICEMSWNGESPTFPNKAQSEANAHLIASAPSLLSALREAREALTPFAKAGELFPPREPDSYDNSIYRPAAGDEYSLCGDDLRKARATLAKITTALASAQGEKA